MLPWRVPREHDSLSILFSSASGHSRLPLLTDRSPQPEAGPSFSSFIQSQLFCSHLHAHSLRALFAKSENQHPCFQSVAHDFVESGGIREKKSETTPQNARGFTWPEAFASLVNTMALAANARGRASRVPELITSRDNRWLKQFRAAFAGEKPRDPASPNAEIISIEGPHLVETALRAGLQIAAVLVSEAGARHLPALGEWIPESTRLLATSDRLFAQVAATETPQGIAALVHAPQTCFDDLVRGVPLLLIMAGIQDPGNVGTLLRTAEAFGASGAAACPAGLIGTADPFGPKALRASAGSALRLPVLRGVGTPVLLAQLRVAGVRVYATSPGAASFAEAGAGAGASAPTYAGSATQSTGRESARKPLLPWEVNWREPSALLVGNEGAGLPADLIRSSDAVVHIPQAMVREAGAPVDSLNAAVAGAILLYEAARQRGLG